MVQLLVMIPETLRKELRIKAALTDKTMRTIVVEALNMILEKDIPKTESDESDIVIS